jgi:hypothetical protein
MPARSRTGKYSLDYAPDIFLILAYAQLKADRLGRFERSGASDRSTIDRFAIHLNGRFAETVIKCNILSTSSAMRG